MEGGNFAVFSKELLVVLSHSELKFLPKSITNIAVFMDLVPFFYFSAVLNRFLKALAHPLGFIPSSNSTKLLEVADLYINRL